MNAVAPSTISLADRAARHFPSQACVAGFQLLAGDRVALAGVSPDAADATVKSKRARTVRLRRHGEALGVACTCWPTTAEVGACKHVWATLLALDRTGGLDALRTTPRPLVLVPLLVPLDVPLADPPAAANRSAAANRKEKKEKTAKNERKPGPAKARTPKKKRSASAPRRR